MSSFHVIVWFVVMLEIKKFIQFFLHHGPDTVPTACDGVPSCIIHTYTMNVQEFLDDIVVIQQTLSGQISMLL